MSGDKEDNTFVELGYSLPDSWDSQPFVDQGDSGNLQPLWRFGHRKSYIADWSPWKWGTLVGGDLGASSTTQGAQPSQQNEVPIQTYFRISCNKQQPCDLRELGKNEIEVSIDIQTTDL